MRDRAVLLVQTLSQLLPASSSSANHDGEDGEDPALSALSPEEVRHCLLDERRVFLMVSVLCVSDCSLTGGAALSAGRGPAIVFRFSRALGQGVPRPSPRTFLLLCPSVFRIAAGGGGGLRTCCLGRHQEEEGYVRTWVLVAVSYSSLSVCACVL